VIAGPTAGGKTQVALNVAENTGAVVLSADAMQIYRGMDVGTGKCPVSARRGVAHFGIDLRFPDQPSDLGDYIAHADRVIQEHERVILVGGTSLYVRGVIRGLVETPPVAPALRAELEASSDLHRRLTEVDPALAARLHPNDQMRLVRGLEVYLCSGERLSELQAIHAQAPDRYQVQGFWLDRGDLDERIDRRVQEMIEEGYAEEVRGLLDQGYHRELKPMQSLGYRYLCSHILDSLPLERAVELTQRDTRRFARKQRTWGKNFDFARYTDDFSQVESFQW
jgi:tRNA dimethylallyltransferase